MKIQLIFYGLFFSNLIALGCEPQTKKMIRVHCDVNKTIICTDAVQGKGLEETVNGILAEFTFDKWDGSTNQSYYAFTTAQLIRNHPELSQTTDEFKKERNTLLAGFSEFLKKFPTQYATYQADRAKMLAILNTEKTVIFPSFLKLVAWLNSNYKHRFALYLRTFGIDLPEIMPKIEQKSELTFEGIGSFKGNSLSIPASLRYANTVALDFFTHSTSHCYGIQDDYNHWKSKGFQAKGGKPFLVGSYGNEIEIFFDDNADDPVKPIICPIDSEGKMIDTAELLQKGIIVAVNPKEAILNENYFIEKLQARLAGNIQ